MTNLKEREMIIKLVAMPNANRVLMGGSTGPVKGIIAENNVVFGIWADPEEVLGVGTLIVKGEPRLAAIASAGKATPPGVARLFPNNEMKLSAVPCGSYEQAFVLRRQFGDGAIEVPK
jgi:hypothetical protein